MNKIVYFDKETINNILQEKNKGKATQTTESNISHTTEGNMSASTEVAVAVGVPFFSRLSFLFTGKIKKSYLSSVNENTSVTSTDISEFNTIRFDLKEYKNVQLADIENSSTSFRAICSFMGIMKEGMEGLDVEEIKTVMECYDGYDTYKLDDKTYVRFNNTSFVSNYKRNDLLKTKLVLYCIEVGSFEKERFDFLKEVDGMKNLFSKNNSFQTLADAYPIKKCENPCDDGSSKKDNQEIILYDVLYASIEANNHNGAKERE